MALKQFFSTEEEVPTELKEHYTAKDGRYVLTVDGIENLPGLTSKNAELIAKQKADKAEQDRLTNELAESKIEIGKLSGDIAKASANGIPTGYVAVPKKEAEALKAFSEKGLKVEEVATQLQELDTLKGKVSEIELDQAIKSFAEAEKIENVDALSGLIKSSGVKPLVKEIEENGKKEKRGFLTVTNGDKTEEKSYKDYLEANWKPFEAALKPTDKKRTVASGHDPKPAVGDDDEEQGKAAAASQARATHSMF